MRIICCVYGEPLHATSQRRVDHSKQSIMPRTSMISEASVVIRRSKWVVEEREYGIMCSMEELHSESNCEQDSRVGWKVD